MSEHLAEFVGGPLHTQTRPFSVEGEHPEQEMFYPEQVEQFVAGQQVMVEVLNIYRRNDKPEFIGPMSTIWKYHFTGTVN